MTEGRVYTPPVEGLLVLLDLAARQLVEFRVHVHKLVLLLHLLALLELVVDPLSPAEQAAEFGVRWHDPGREIPSRS